MTEWKQWTPANVGSEPLTAQIKGLFADGIVGEPATVSEWALVKYAPAPIVSYMVVEG